jgi:hypothetical protein
VNQSCSVSSLCCLISWEWCLSVPLCDSVHPSFLLNAAFQDDTWAVLGLAIVLIVLAAVPTVLLIRRLLRQRKEARQRVLKPLAINPTSGEALHQAFNWFDKDHSGTLDMRELQQLVKACYPTLSRAMHQRLYSRAQERNAAAAEGAGIEYEGLLAQAEDWHQQVDRILSHSLPPPTWSAVAANTNTSHQHATSTPPARHQHATSTPPARHQHATSTPPARHQHATSALRHRG